MNKTKHKWEICKWDGNDEKPYCDWVCHSLKYQRGKLTLYPSQFKGVEWNYTASFGANHDLSHSGCFPGLNLEQAKAAIEKQILCGKYD